jgi:hypothetical protein
VIQTYHALFAVGFIAAGFSICQYLFLSRGSVDSRLTGFMGHWMTLSGEMMLVFIGLATYFVFLNPQENPWCIFCVVGVSLALTPSVGWRPWLDWWSFVVEASHWSSR